MCPDSPAFGQADLSNCERELIHLAGSIQPHGALLVLDPATLEVPAASANAAALLGLAPANLLGRPLSGWAPGLAEQVRRCAPAPGADGLLLPDLAPPAGSTRGRFEAVLHRTPGGPLVLELEPLDTPPTPTVHHEHAVLMPLVGDAVQQLGQAATLGVLADATVKCVRHLIGHDRVMVYKFDADGHGEIIAEARDPRLESLLGHHYPATDIPQRARELYLRNRVRVLADVHAPAAPLLRADGTPVGDTLDMSLCTLRSMSPLHLQYLKNMGVTATLVVSLVRQGRLWGLIAAHHYAPRNVSHALRAACDLLGEVVSTRIAAIENYAHAQVAVLVRRLEQRLVEATSTEGDWRLALFRNPRTLLQPLEATGAALFTDDELLTAGEVPSTPELRELHRWVQLQAGDDTLFASNTVAKANPALASLAPTASGVLAVRLSTTRPDCMMWLRKEQLHTVTWAGDPHKPMVDDDPLQLSPRRSFAAWSELVRGTALPWTTADLALGRAFGLALVDIIVQVHAVRLLVAEHQLDGIRAAVRHAGEPVLIANADGRVLFCNAACDQLAGAGAALAHLHDLASLFTRPQAMRDVLAALGRGQPSWRGELALAHASGTAVPVAVRAESVPGRGGRPLGIVLTLFDLRHNKRAAAARQHLEAALQRNLLDAAAASAGREPVAAAPAAAVDPLLGAILTNASLAAMDITEGAPSVPQAPLLEELEQSTRRATALYERLRGISR